MPRGWTVARARITLRLCGNSVVTVLELFAGAGGAALGLQAAGFESVGLCEWDADACETLRAAGFSPVIEGDVRDLEAIEAGITASPDVLWSSFPCQAWSTAGSRKGAQDDRNGWPWTVAAIDRFRPRWVLCENVRGLLCHSAKGCGDSATCPRCYFDRVILADLRARFAHVGWWLLDAADFGVPQHRRRVILWGGPRPLSRPEATHADPAELAQAGLFADRQPWRGWGDALISCASFRDLSRQSLSIDQRITMETSKATFELCDPAATMSTKACHTYIGIGDGCMTVRSDTWRSCWWTGRRSLLPEECATLQGFPVDHPFQGTKTSRYRQAGNAVPPKLAEVVARAVLAAEAR